MPHWINLLFAGARLLTLEWPLPLLLLPGAPACCSDRPGCRPFHLAGVQHGNSSTRMRFTALVVINTIG